MPYNALSELPDAVQKMPKHAQEIYMGAYNGAWEQYKDRGKQREALAHATAWAAVEKQYEKRNGRWVTKEAKMLSDKNRSKLLQAALVTEYKIGQSTPIPKSLTIDDVFEDKVIYDIDGQLYESNYELDEDGKATFGEPAKVLSTKVYKTMESLQAIYSDIIQEAGKRNASLDSDRLRKILTLCQELLSNEAESDEDKVKDATGKAAEALAWLKSQDNVKIEDGIKYPREAFAYVPDSDEPSGWQLRIWETPDLKATKKQVKIAATYLSGGGFDGKRVSIPAERLAEVKRKLRSEYLNLEMDDMPKWIKDPLTRELVNSYTTLSEAKFDKGRATVIVIKPGFNATSDRYYPIEMLKRDYKIFEGAKMYADHPTETEDKEKPERSMGQSWVGVLKDVICDEAGIVTGIAEIIEPWLMQKLASLREKKMLSEMGISINAAGFASKATIEGKETLVIERLDSCRSVDFVTEPGAGGIVTFYEADRSRDVDLVELPALRERRPDLVKLIESNVRAEISKEVKKSMENEERIKELEGQNETLTTENTSLKDKITEAEKAKAKAEAQAAIKVAVDKAENLPQAAKACLIERYKDAETADGITEAIQSEVDYIAQLSESGKVKNLGANTKPDVKEEEALREAIKRANPEFTEAQLEIAVTGR